MKKMTYVLFAACLLAGLGAQVRADDNVPNIPVIDPLPVTVIKNPLMPIQKPVTSTQPTCQFSCDFNWTTGVTCNYVCPTTSAE